MTDRRTGKIAGAPISWGVCEVAGWGYQMGSERVLGEMRALGLTATEAGPKGFLPEDPAENARELAAMGLSLVGGFTPLVLHEPGRWRDELEQVLCYLVECNSEVVVLAAATGLADYDSHTVLSSLEWTRLYSALEAAVEMATEAGLRAVLHPHVGTVVETPDEIERVLEGTSIQLCLDTGHVMAGGGDPLALAVTEPARIGHVHLKDVHAEIAAWVTSGRVSYGEAVREGLYCPLGEGDVEVTAIVDALEGAGYEGWYVLEQDVMLDEEPQADGGPQSAVGKSLVHLEDALVAAR